VARSTQADAVAIPSAAVVAAMAITVMGIEDGVVAMIGLGIGQAQGRCFADRDQGGDIGAAIAARADGNARRAMDLALGLRIAPPKPDQAITAF